MFKKSRIRIVIVTMSVLILLFAGTLCVIYFSSYSDVFRQNQEMLSRYAQAYWENETPTENNKILPDLPPDKIKGDRAYRLLSFYSVAFSETGEIMSIDNNTSMGISDEDLTELSEHLISKNRDSGIYGSWVYLIETHQGCTLVVLMDNMITKGNIGTLLRYTILFGSITIVLLFLVSLFLARRIVQPLEESYQKQKQFISDAGHELKTPIAVVSTNLEMLEREFGQSKWLDNARFETNRMTGLIRQLLELARAENSKPQMNRINLSRIVTGGVLPFECVAFEKNRSLQTNIQDEIYIWGNAEQLGNLVSILTDNALSYAPEHSVITVTLKAERNRVLLSVSNEGSPIPEEQKKHLFERFYRTNPAREEDISHYGLGLAIARAILTSHHGKIEVNYIRNQVVFTASIPIHSKFAASETGTTPL